MIMTRYKCTLYIEQEVDTNECAVADTDEYKSRIDKSIESTLEKVLRDEITDDTATIKIERIKLDFVETV